jgi:uncharacterized membrane protein
VGQWPAWASTTAHAGRRRQGLVAATGACLRLPGALFGTAAACLAVTVASILSWHQPYAGYLLSGGLLYLLGAIGVTITFHVPRNQALDRVRPGSPDAAGHWNRYVTTWTAANHVRAAAALAAAAVLTVALTAH